MRLLGEVLSIVAKTKPTSVSLEASALWLCKHRARKKEIEVIQPCVGGVGPPRHVDGDLTERTRKQSPLLVARHAISSRATHS